jgi:Cd2+/Zn2+-exporting ATPase
VTVVALDKTGTLTMGKPVVQEVVSLNGMNSSALLSLVGSVERFSEHPIGKAIVEACHASSLALEEPGNFKVQPGFGVTASTSKGNIIVGSRALLKENGYNWSSALETKVSTLEKAGHIVIPVGMDGEVIGLVSLVDKIRPEAKRAVAELKKMGIKEVIMITGDNPYSAERIAKEMGIDRFYSQVLPQDKLKIIRELQAEGNKVLFAGDGVNDAPALAAADIGVAMGLGGTHLALETAQIGLMADEIERLPEIIRLSRQALKVIRLNILFSMSVNLIAVFLGSFGLIGPVVGALIHEGSSVPVLANSARLVNYKLSE